MNKTELRHITEIATLMRWREEVLGCVFGEQPSAELLKANLDYYERHVADGTHIAYIAISDRHEAGCGAICIYDEMPSPDNHSGRCAYLMNIYVREPFRHAGVATAIVERLIEEARTKGCGKIYLETTDMARSLYEELNFKPMEGYLKL